MSKSQPHIQGFTLFELLVSMSVLSVVATISAMGFFTITDHWNGLVLRQHMNQSVTNVFAEMTRDFENVVTAEIGGMRMRGQMADTEDNHRFWRLSFEDDRLSLPVAVYNSSEDAWEHYKIRYAIERNRDNGPELIRYARRVGVESSSEVETVSFSGVTGMRINYFDGRIWQSQWDSERMPDAVRVSISVMQDLRVDRHLSRIATFRVFVD